MTGVINVRIPGANKNIFVNLDEMVTVDDVKEAISKNADLDPKDFSLIFSGKYLQEATLIEDLQLGRNSILHVLLTQKNVPSAQKDQTQTQVNVASSGSRYYYYVYCRQCDGLQPGKLRLRCTGCEQGALVLDQEPSCWDDILVSNRLGGLCSICDNRNSAQFFFKCCCHDDDDAAIPLRYICPNSRSVECITCTDIQSPILVYPCPDKHVMCVDCFQSYCTVNLDNRTFIQHPELGYTLPCPGCDDSLIQDIHHFHLLGKDQYERYKDFGAEECLLQTGGIICPNRGCGEGIILDESATTVQCTTCWYEFCRRCHNEIHSGECLLNPSGQQPSQVNPVDGDRALRARWDTQSQDTIQKTTKACPKCLTRTERNGGCMHMKCSRCRQDWCWLCEKTWDRSCQGEHWFG